MEHSIGTCITLEVVEIDDPICEGCFFKSVADCENVECLGSRRTDGKNIIYKEIKEE